MIHQLSNLLNSIVNNKVKLYTIRWGKSIVNNQHNKNERAPLKKKKKQPHFITYFEAGGAPTGGGKRKHRIIQMSVMPFFQSKYILAKIPAESTRFP